MGASLKDGRGTSMPPPQCIGGDVDSLLGPYMARMQVAEEVMSLSLAACDVVPDDECHVFLPGDVPLSRCRGVTAALMSPLCEERGTL